MSSPVLGSYEAKTHLPQVLRKVQAGQSFDIAIRGVTVARLVPAAAPEQQRTLAVAKMKAFVQAQNQNGAGKDVDLSDWINEGRA